MRPSLPDPTDSLEGARMVMDGPFASHGDDGIDTAVLPGLFARLGDAVAADLRHQLGADLHRLRQMLGTAQGPPPDMATVARQAHVLIALAGTVGATGLVARARLLWRAAHRGEAGASVRLGLEILPHIDALLAFVAACPLPADRTLP